MGVYIRRAPVVVILFTFGPGPTGLVAAAGGDTAEQPRVNVCGFEDENDFVLFSDVDENAASSTVVKASSVEGRQGSAVHLQWDVQDRGYAGLAVPLNDLSIADFDRVSFQVMLAGPSVPSVHLQIAGQDGRRVVKDLKPLLSNLDEGWNKVSVAVSEFNAPKEILENPRDLAIVVRAGANSLMLDEISLEGVADQQAVRSETPLPDDHGAAEGRTLQWSGQFWRVRPPGDAPQGPGPNFWSDSERVVWLDEQQRLHMAMRRYEGQWYCSEVLTEKSLGYGTYRFKVTADLGRVHPNVVIGLFTYLNDESEIDIELSKWGDVRESAYTCYTNQPGAREGNSTLTDTPLDTQQTTHEFTWRKDRIEFRSYPGHDYEGEQPYYEWVYRGPDIPEAGLEKLHINYWLMLGAGPNDENVGELIVDEFSFEPLVP